MGSFFAYFLSKKVGGEEVKMKIMMLAGAMGSGGAQTHVFELARALIKRGHKIILVSSGGQTARALSRLGVRCYCVNVDVSKPWSVIGGIGALHALILRQRPDIIHAHTRPMGLLCRLLKRRTNELGIAYISTVHARFSTDSPIKKLPWYSGDSIAVSEDLKHYLIDLSRGSLLPERIRVIPNGIDTDRFSPKPRTSLNGAFSLCFMSRLDDDCSDTARLLCDIAPKICETVGEAQIYIIGGGTELTRISALAKKANQRIGRLAVRVLGKLDAPELVIARCDGFIGVSRAALEAMSCGLPVILSGNEGFGGLMKTEDDLREASRSNFCCRDMKQPSADKLLDSILRLYSLPKPNRIRLGQKMRRFVTENSSSEKMAESTERVYSDALSRARSRHPHTLLCGYYGFDNMGDDALLMQSIERAKPCGTVALTNNPRRAEYKFGVKCADRSNPLAIMREINNCQRLAFGGGSLLQSRTSFRSLCWYCAILIYAKSRGKRVELWANGIDGFSGYFSRALVARALQSTDKIGVRDTESAATAFALAPQQADRIFFEKDLALDCPAADDAEISCILSRSKIPEGERFAIVAPKGYSGISLLRPKARRQILSDYALLKARVLALRRRNITPLFVAMYPAQDLYISRRMCQACGGRILNRIGISELRGLISRSDEVISMRYHPLIFAQRLKTPYFKISNDPKITSL